MPNPILTTRVDPSIVDRVQACAEAYTAKSEPGAPETDRGAIVRMLILRGLPAMEAELGITNAAAKTAKKRAR